MNVSAEVFLVVAGVASFCLVMGFGGLIAWACGILPNEPEYYRYQKMRKAQKRRRKALR